MEKATREKEVKLRDRVAIIKRSTRGITQQEVSATSKDTEKVERKRDTK